MESPDRQWRGRVWFCSPSCVKQGSSGTWKRQKRSGPARTVGKVVKWTLIVLGLLIVVFVAGALLTLKSHGSNGGSCPTCAADSSASPTAASIRSEINRIRRHAHLKPLRAD